MNVHTKALCFLFLVASASCASLPETIIDVGKSIVDGTLELPTNGGDIQNILNVLENLILDVLKTVEPNLLDDVLNQIRNWVEDLINSSASSGNNNGNTSNEGDQSNGNSGSDESNTNNESNQSNGNNGSNESDANNESNQSNGNSGSNESNESNGSSGSNESDESNVSNGSGESDESDEGDESLNKRRRRDLLSSFSDISSNVLGQNDLTQLLSFNPLGNLTQILSKVDFSKVTKSIPKIPTPQDVNSLPVLPGLRENIQYARNLTVHALGGWSDLQTAIQNATERAVHSINPVDALTSLCYTILRVYYNIALNSPLYIVAGAVLQDGLLTIGSVIRSVISVLSSDVQKAIGVIGAVAG